jgi:signal transduction histidine kinase
MTPYGSRGGSFRGVMSRVRNTIGWVRGLDPVRADLLLAVVFLVSFEVQASLVAAHPRVRFAQALTGLAIAVAIVIRRRWMVQALLLACLVFVGKRVLIGDQAAGQGGVGGLLGMLLLFYGCGAFLEGRRVWLGLGISLALGTAISLVQSSLLAAVFGDVAFVLLPFLVGRSRRLAIAREHAAREQAERLDSERELHVRTAALGERMRLAREIHDVIAHSVSVMVIQAAGARTVMDRDPSRAESSLRAVERAGREALAEMRRLLGVLADGQDLRALAPQPGLEDLPELLSSTRAAGLKASIRVDGDPVAVSQGLSLCAYRVVQEALMNTLKHAGPTRAEVYLGWCHETLELRVSDEGRVAARGDSEPVGGSSGHGIVGMRERAALHGGSVEAGSAPDGGFVVRATIPLIAGSVT